SASGRERGVAGAQPQPLAVAAERRDGRRSCAALAGRAQHAGARVEREHPRGRVAGRERERATAGRAAEVDGHAWLEIEKTEALEQSSPRLVVNEARVVEARGCDESAAS